VSATVLVVLVAGSLVGLGCRLLLHVRLPVPVRGLQRQFVLIVDGQLPLYQRQMESFVQRLERPLHLLEHDQTLPESTGLTCLAAGADGRPSARRKYSMILEGPMAPAVKPGRITQAWRRGW